MTQSRPMRVGIMGFGQTGRQIYELASRSEDVEVVAIADIGKPEILHYLLRSEVAEPSRHELQGNFLVNPRFRTRLLQIEGKIIGIGGGGLVNYSRLRVEHHHAGGQVRERDVKIGVCRGLARKQLSRAHECLDVGPEI